MSAKLNHARVLVVGGSSGIGLATAAAAAGVDAELKIFDGMCHYFKDELIEQ